MARWPRHAVPCCSKKNRVPGGPWKLCPYSDTPIPTWQSGMNEPVRDEIHTEFFDWLRGLQFHGDGYKDGKVFETWGICYVPNPCAPGRE